MKDLINNYFENVKDTIDSLNRDEIIQVIDVLEKAKNNGNNIFVMGNGGSAATASHFVCDFNKGIDTNNSDSKRFRLICLNDNLPTLMAYANDVSYDDIFVEQLINLMNKDDIVLAISGSGNSKNIIKAIDYANSKGGVTIGLTGFDGGLLKRISQHAINVCINNMQISEDIHMILNHLIVTMLYKKVQATEITKNEIIC